jgi:galactan endo-1,6-beta-galactosidase
MRAGLTLLLAEAVLFAFGAAFPAGAAENVSRPASVKVDASDDLGSWEGWGSSLAWWARAVGGTGNSDYYADLVYTTKTTDGYPGLGLNIVRYNVGGGGINQAQENKGGKLEWQMDIHGYWPDPDDRDPTKWNWAADLNQRSLMLKARDRGANVFEMFSNSPLWWMNRNRSTAGSDTGANCLLPEHYDRFAFYLAQVARYSADHWGIKFDSVEPFNEPSAGWWRYPQRQEGCHFNVSAQQAVLEHVRRALDRAHLNDVAVAAADENNTDTALRTWNGYDSATRALVGRVNVHGYPPAIESDGDRQRVALRRAIGRKRLWQSEYGDDDASGYTMAQAIIRDLKQLQPAAWVYWQPVEPDVPEFGWGLLNANYIDTHDQMSWKKTPLVRVNRKFFVYGQFTRYIRPGYHLVSIEDPNSLAAYDPSSHRLVIVTVTGSAEKSVSFDLSRFVVTANSIQIIATTTHPGGNVPDWKQHDEPPAVEAKGSGRLVGANLYPMSVYTFVIAGVSR